MRTFTITTVTDREATWGLSSNVVESAESALAHLEAMSRDRESEPFIQITARSWRWTWEWVADNGRRCTDTVRLVP